MDKDAVIRQLDKMLRDDLDARVQTEYPADRIWNSKKILLFRSAPLPLFEKFLSRCAAAGSSAENGAENGAGETAGEAAHRSLENAADGELLLIGKDADAAVLQKYWKGRFSVIGIEGNYTADKLLPYADRLKEFSADTVLFFSKVFPDENYIHIYEIVEKLSLWFAESCRPQIVCSDFDGNLAKISSMEQYMAALRLHLALADWYWRCTK